MSEHEAAVVEDPSALEDGDAREPTADGGAEATAEDERDPLVEIVASKILNDWLRNRQQLLAPFRIDLQKIDAGEIDMLLQAMIVAAQADGTVEGRERERVRNALEQLNASAGQLASLEAALDRPKPLAHALAAVDDVRTGAIVYAASLLAIDRRKLVNRQYLRYLAARLQLPRDVTRALEQRFYAAVD